MKRAVLVAFVAVVAIMFSAPLFAQGSAEKGKALFTSEKCGMCHNQKMNTLDSKNEYFAKLSAKQIEDWITNPTAQTPSKKSTMKMPKRTLKNDQVADLVAYLQQLQK